MKLLIRHFSLLCYLVRHSPLYPCQLTGFKHPPPPLTVRVHVTQLAKLPCCIF